MRLRRSIEIAVWLIALSATAACLIVLGRGELALPANSLAAWNAWLHQSDPALVVLALVRVGALAAALYLMATFSVVVLTSLLRIRPLLTLASAMTTPLGRRIAERTLGLSLAGALAVPAMAGATTSTDVPMLHHLVESDADPRLDPPAPSVISEPSITQPVQSAVAPTQSVTHTHLVLTGENLWGIADTELTAVLGRRPTTEEVRTYWLKVIAGNRVRLADTKNPDLIFPGQIIQLPESA